MVKKKWVEDRIFFLKNDYMEMELFRRIKESYFGKYSIFDIAYPLSMSQNAKKSHTRWRLQQ
ncbi:hypothetical protein [Escherichia coli]|uniref:hypothetical protein n=1 Tax=Escherichia coli TaxID=562 RepID=UPI0002C8EAF8|nr:hypothetical protein [Escherichia coli]EGD9355888.1 hypothetical protein [Escherichia coli]EGE0617399.1 hypothetical protein [Escherichia coli]EMV50983.1 hypothetical protein EC2871950_4935 [Escherichia coli 2871950]EMZ60165.1 hypothetical protein EC2846750_4784 [Escherichia coli 2846750]